MTLIYWQEFELPKVIERIDSFDTRQFIIPDQLILQQNAFSQKRLVLQVEAGDVILRVNEVDVNRFSTKEGKKDRPASASPSRYNAHSTECTFLFFFLFFFFYNPSTFARTVSPFYLRHVISTKIYVLVCLIIQSMIN